jgi:hypothetical protein
MTKIKYYFSLVMEYVHTSNIKKDLLVRHTPVSFCFNHRIPTIRQDHIADLTIQAQIKLWPIEIKLISTPSSRNIKPIQEFKALAGKEAAPQGVLVCRTSKKTALPEKISHCPGAVFRIG